MEFSGDLPEQLIDQRVRNRVIECLELLASPDEQAHFGAPAVVEFWLDWVHEPIDSNYQHPVFCEGEREAMKRVNSAVEDICNSPALRRNPSDELQSPLWTKLTLLANESLMVFARRGRFPEDRVTT